jgi:hypothetical protein
MVNIVESPLFIEAYRDFRQGKTDVALDEKEAALFDYRSLKREELNRILERGFWIGPDIAIATSATIAPGEQVFVPISLPDKPVPFPNFDHPYAFSVLHASTRSRFAQLGLEVLQSTGFSIAQTLYIEPKEDKPGELRAIIPVVNRAARPIHLPEGVKFFYPYYWEGDTITDHSLKDLLGSEIKINGVEGKDWRWWYGQISKDGGIRREHVQRKELQGIEFFLNPESQAWIPPSDKPMTISDAQIDNHNRAEIDQFLKKPIPESNEPLFWIAETSASLEISPAIHGLVDWVVTQSGEPVATDDNSHHQANSTLIRGGNTFGKMRVEIFSPTTKDVIPKTVLLRFAQA